MCYRSRLLINKFNARGIGYVLERRFSKLVEITQSKSHYDVQGHSRSFKVPDFSTNRKLICDFLLVINTNLPPILHRFRKYSFGKVQNRCIWLRLFGLTPDGRVSLGRSP